MKALAGFYQISLICARPCQLSTEDSVTCMRKRVRNFEVKFSSFPVDHAAACDRDSWAFRNCCAMPAIGVEIVVADDHATLTFLELPSEVILMVLCDLDARNLARLSATCVDLHKPMAPVDEVLRQRAAARGRVCPVCRLCAAWLDRPHLGCVAAPGRLALLEWRRDGAWAPVAAGPCSSFFVAHSGRLMSCGVAPGVLGLGTTPLQCLDGVHPLIEPTQLPSMARIRFNRVSAGWFFVAAVSVTGAVYTWGVDEEGCLGHGGDSNADDGDADGAEFDEGSRVPMLVSALAGHCVLSVATGYSHCLAVTESGAVFSWGRDSHGECGHGGEILSQPGHVQWRPRRIDALAGTRAVDASAGVVHSLVVTDEGALYAFGEGTRGRLGHGSSDSVRSPVIVDALRHRFITAAAAGHDHTLALTADGMVFAWGNNRSGQLGMGYRGISERLARQVPPQILSCATVVAAGDRCSCAVTAVGEIFVWGLQHYRQRRLGFRESAHSPIRVDALCGELVVAVSTSATHSIAVTKDGSVYAWGWADALGMPADESLNGVYVPRRTVVCRRYPTLSCVPR